MLPEQLTGAELVQIVVAVSGLGVALSQLAISLGNRSKITYLHACLDEHRQEVAEKLGITTDPPKEPP